MGIGDKFTPLRGDGLCGDGEGDEMADLLPRTRPLLWVKPPSFSSPDLAEDADSGTLCNSLLAFALSSLPLVPDTDCFSAVLPSP